jgi:3-oxoacyl-[acyl-carrier protein] reductase
VKARALVTGASRGIGAAIAQELARIGHPVIVHHRSNTAAAERVRAAIVEQGGQAELAQFDVADAAATREAIEGLLAGGEIGVLVNNAGVAHDAPFPAMKPEQWRAVISTALDGFFNVTQPLVMPMARRRWGRIVNMSSISGLVGNRGQVNYSAAKAGILGATRSLAQELAKRNVTVNAVAPGLVETDMTVDLPRDEVLKLIPMRRFGRADEVAKLVAFLVGEDAGYITGQVIGINGGMI